MKLGRFHLREVIGGALLLFSGLGVALSQPRAADIFGKLGKDSGVYAIPQPEHLIVFSLGYRSALADLIFGRTMVDVGIHFVERRAFDHLEAYLWAIIGLDPRIRDLYGYADTMLTLSTIELPAENFRYARDIVERGLKEYPDDAELWMSAGMFLSFVAPPRLPKEEDSSEWKAAGARMIEHGCALLPKSEPLPPTCITGARLFARVGQTEAAIRNVERLLNITDDEATRAQAMTYLTQLLGERAARRREQLARSREEQRLADLPVLERDQYQLVLPKTEVRSCAGVFAQWERPDCVSAYSRRELLGLSEEGD